MKTGIIQVTLALFMGKRSLMATAASRKPRKRLPVSPIKTRAGFQL